MCRELFTLLCIQLCNDLLCRGPGPLRAKILETLPLFLSRVSQVFIFCIPKSKCRTLLDFCGSFQISSSFDIARYLYAMSKHPVNFLGGFVSCRVLEMLMCFCASSLIAIECVVPASEKTNEGRGSPHTRPMIILVRISTLFVTRVR